MRPVGLLPELRDVAAADHICWVHEDQAAFDAAVRNVAVGGLSVVGASHLVQRMWQVLALADVAPATFVEPQT